MILVFLAYFFAVLCVLGSIGLYVFCGVHDNDIENHVETNNSHLLDQEN